MCGCRCYFARPGVLFHVQRRRLNIAIELVGAPAVLFVDDATAGLDSTTAQQVMSCLQRVAQSGADPQRLLGVLCEDDRPWPTRLVAGICGHRRGIESTAIRRRGTQWKSSSRRGIGHRLLRLPRRESAPAGIRDSDPHRHDLEG